MAEHDTDLYDYIILGAGPAGLQLAYFLSKGLHRYVVMERADRPGSFFLEMPRSRTLISFNKVHSLYSDPELRLRWDWNSLLTDNYELLFEKFSKTAAHNLSITGTPGIIIFALRSASISAPAKSMPWCV